MKLIARGRIPPPPEQPWLNRFWRCKNCGERILLEKGDVVAQYSPGLWLRNEALEYFCHTENQWTWWEPAYD